MTGLPVPCSRSDWGWGPRGKQTLPGGQAPGTGQLLTQPGSRGEGQGRAAAPPPGADPSEWSFLDVGCLDPQRLPSERPSP